MIRRVVPTIVEASISTTTEKPRDKWTKEDRRRKKKRINENANSSIVKIKLKQSIVVIMELPSLLSR